MKIEDVIDRLGVIVGHERGRGSRLGYFAALYRRMTIEIQTGLRNGEFEDPAFVERLDVAFAERYFDAYAAWQARKPVTRAWEVAFAAAPSSKTVALQHLLLGINAHINLDLGIVTAQLSGDLGAVRRDFYQVNLLIRRLIDQVQERVNRVSPGFRLLDQLGGSLDETLFDFSLVQAREFAWRFANELALLDDERRQKRITQVDIEVAARGAFIVEPGPLARLTLCAVRWLEERDVARVIDTLTFGEPAAAAPLERVA